MALLLDAAAEVGVEGGGGGLDAPPDVVGRQVDVELGRPQAGVAGDQGDVVQGDPAALQDRAAEAPEGVRMELGQPEPRAAGR
jgi:hypothetical protein